MIFVKETPGWLLIFGFGYFDLGGSLFNMAGEVVAINSQIYTRSGGYMGISFAIPIDLAMGIKEQFLKDGKVTRCRLGVSHQDVSHQAVDETIAQAFRLETATGALINEVGKSSPADKAGIIPGDIVLKFDGATVQISNDLPRFVAGAKPGSLSSVEVWRRGQRKMIKVTIESGHPMV